MCQLIAFIIKICLLRCIPLVHKLTIVSVSPPYIAYVLWLFLQVSDISYNNRRWYNDQVQFTHTFILNVLIQLLTYEIPMEILGFILSDSVKQASLDAYYFVSRIEIVFCDNNRTV